MEQGLEARSRRLLFLLPLLLLFGGASGNIYAGQCFQENPALSPAYSVLTPFRSNASLENADECVSACSRHDYVLATVHEGSFCVCFNGTDELVAVDAPLCELTCSDGSACGGADNAASLYEVPTRLGFIELSPGAGGDALALGASFAIEVTASAEWVVDWGVGGDVKVDVGASYTYDVSGDFQITVFLKALPHIRQSTWVRVHDKPDYTIECPSVLTLYEAAQCDVTSYRQGFLHDILYSVSNASATQQFSGFIPGTPSVTAVGSYRTIVGTGLKTLSPANHTGLTVLRNSLIPNGGYFFRIRVQSEVGGAIGIYAVLPNCAAESSLSCASPVLCPTISGCSDESSGCSCSPTDDKVYKLLDTIEVVTPGDYDFELEEVVRVPPGAQIAFGCLESDCPNAIPTVYIHDAYDYEVTDTYLDVSSTPYIATPTTTVATVQVFVRESAMPPLEAKLLCESAAPVPVAEAGAPPFTIATEQFIHEGRLTLNYQIKDTVGGLASDSPKQLLCQQEIVLSEMETEVWMAHGTPRPFSIIFSQGSPLFSSLDIEGVMHYDYFDDAVAGYALTINLVYVDEGLHLFTGNTTNLLGNITYESVIHVVPPVTDSWVLEVLCPCYDIDLGFSYTLDLASAPHPPWNATMHVFTESGATTEEKTTSELDFETFGAEGAAVALTRTFETTVLTVGTYTFTVNLTNVVSSTTIFKEILVEEGIRGVTADILFESTDGLMPAMGYENNIVIANFSTFFKSNTSTGVPLKWNVTIFETGEVIEFTDPANPPAHIFDTDGTYTYTVSGYNTVQGWVTSSPNTLRVVSKIQGFELTDDGIVKKPGVSKTVIANFFVFTPLACMVVSYGDGAYETFGYETRCKEEYPDVAYKGPKEAPITLTHTYSKEGKYKVFAMAADNLVSLPQTLDVVIADVPCTMPSIRIVNGEKIEEYAPEKWRSLPVRYETISNYECTRIVPILRWWKIYKIDQTGSETEVVIEGIIESWNYSQIALPVNFLEYGLYRFMYYLNIQASTVIDLERNDYTFINITKSTLEAVILSGGPSMLTRGFGEIIALDPQTFSRDPDYPDKNNELTFTWWCRQLSPKEGDFPRDVDGNPIEGSPKDFPDRLEAARVGNAKGGCFGDGDGNLDSYYRFLQLDTSRFVLQDGTYEITLKVSKDTRASFTTLTIEVKSEPPPLVTITCSKTLCYQTSTAYIINPSTRLDLSGACEKFCADEMTYEWTFVDPNGESAIDKTPCEINGEADCDKAISDPSLPTIMIYPEFFKINPTVEEFTVRLTISTKLLKIGFTEIKIKKNKPPTEGTCTIDKYDGYALVDNFLVSCGGWKDPENIGIDYYTYYYTSPGSHITIASTSISPLNLVFPVGNFSLYVDVTDMLSGTFNVFIGDVTCIMPSQEQIDLYDYPSTLAHFSSVGDQTSLSMILASLSSIRDNAVWLDLDTSSDTNITDDQLTGRVTEVAKLNTQQLVIVSETMSFATLPQLNVGANVVKQALGAILQNGLGPLTVDSETRSIAIDLLEEMANKLKDIPISSSGELKLFLALTMDSIHALTKGMNSISSSEIEEGNTLIVPPTDMIKDFDYQTDIPDDIHMQIPLDEEEMRKQNVLDRTMAESKVLLKRMKNIMELILIQMRPKLIEGETVFTSGEYGSTIVIKKINEEKLLVIDLEITFEKTLGKLVLPKKFCPSKNMFVNTDCKKVFTIDAVIWPCITYMYPKTSSFLASDAYVLAVQVTIENELIEVKNESISMKIPREGGGSSAGTFINVRENINHLLPIVYHKFEILGFDAGYSIEITPADELPKKTIILIGHERMPTPSNYMIISFLKDFELDANGTYSLFISSKENNNKTGRFFVGVGVLKITNVLNKNIKLKKSDLDSNFYSNYYFGVFSSGCYYFEKEEEEWKSKGLNLVGASKNFVSCETTHLTSFAPGYSALPNSLNFEYIFANPGFLDNISIYITIIILTSLYIIAMIWGHWKDRKDIERRGVIALPDNKPDDKYLYEITFYTGPDKEATTESNISFILSGDYEETDVRFLPPPDIYLYRRFAVNSFVVATSRPLGYINYLRVFHDNSGEPPLDTWQLERVVVRDLQNSERFLFDTNSWLAFDRDECKIDKIFTSTEAEVKGFTQNIYLRSNKATNQDHMWMAMFLRPIGSRFGRKERVTVCAVFLFLSMAISGLWYDMSKESKREGMFDFGPFTFSVEQLIIGTCILFIAYPMIFVLSFVFKRARPRNLKRCRAFDSIEKQRQYQLLEQGINEEEANKRREVEIDEEGEIKTKEKNIKKCLPWWTRPIAWIISLAIIIVSVFFVWAYGIMWGEIKTAKWLSSFLLCFFISILFTQWVKVIITTLFSTIKKEDLSVEDIDCDEELPTLKYDESWYDNKVMDSSIRKKVHSVEGVDNDDPEVNKLMVKLRKQREMKFAIKDIIVYCIFLFIVYAIANMRTDRNAILLKTHFENTFIKMGHTTFDFADKVKTANDWWNWVKSVVLQEVRAQRKYNGDAPLGLRGFLNDYANRIIGYPIIRQIRAKRHNCQVPYPMNNTIERCSGVRDMINEDTKDFCAGWTLNETFHASCKMSEFKYKTATDLGAFASMGRLSMYSGGGYALRLSGMQSTLIERMDILQRNNWIDKNTRAVILEFSVYNPNVNLFVLCTISAEFNEGGGILPKWRFEPINLIKEEGMWGSVSLLCEMLFVLALLFFTIKELWSLKKEKIAYFASYWNIAEICLLVVSYTAVGLYVYRFMLTQEALDKFNTTSGNGYIRMDAAAYIDQFYLYCMGIIVFFSTIKLIKLLQFNKRMSVLSLTIATCWDELKIFLIAFGIIFFSFSCLFFFMFTANIEHFARILSAIQTSFKMMMGKFDFEALNQVNSLSPLFFFIFSVTNNMILINIMLTIIIQGFKTVTENLEKVENKLNLIDFVWTSTKQTARMENLPKIHVQPKLTDKEDTKPKAVDDAKSDHLPDKVGQLLTYINDVYFEGQLDLANERNRKSLMKSEAPTEFIPFRTKGQLANRKIINSE